MNVETMNELGISNVVSTTIILKMADSSQVKPLGVLEQIPTLVANIEYKIDYVVFKTMDGVQSYPGLLGRTWLLDAHAKKKLGKWYTDHWKCVKENNLTFISYPILW
jgi:hypothetical protein